MLRPPATDDAGRIWLVPPEEADGSSREAAYSHDEYSFGCIQSREEARLAPDHGASALGLVSRMPSGPGVIPASTIAEIAARVPPGIGTFLLTSESDPGAIVEQQRRCRVNTLQLCDRIRPEVYAELRRTLPGIALVQVVHVTGEESIQEARLAARHADALLLDSGDPNAAVKILGGTGRTHDWSLSRRIREAVDVPVFLAGGLRAENVVQASAPSIPSPSTCARGCAAGAAWTSAGSPLSSARCVRPERRRAARPARLVAALAPRTQPSLAVTQPTPAIL
jgi:phosphoribosylanthranilate isomerase